MEVGSDSLLTLGMAVMIGLSLSAIENEGRWHPGEFSVRVVLWYRNDRLLPLVNKAELWSEPRNFSGMCHEWRHTAYDNTKRTRRLCTSLTAGGRGRRSLFGVKNPALGFEPPTFG